MHKGPVTRKMFPIDDVIMNKDPNGVAYLPTSLEYHLNHCNMTFILRYKVEAMFGAVD